MAELSRTERRRAERQARKELHHKEREKKIRTGRAQKLALYFLGTLLLLGAGYWAYGQWASGSPGQFVPSMGNRHVSPSEMGLTKYKSDPPSSGPHTPSLANWGVHDSPIPKEVQVHNLEDGGIVIQYNCDRGDPDCKSLIEKLAGVARRYDHTIVAPYPGMSHKIALTAWTRIDKFNEFDEKRIMRFIDAYIHIDHHPRK